MLAARDVPSERDNFQSFAAQAARLLLYELASWKIMYTIRIDKRKLRRSIHRLAKIKTLTDKKARQEDAIGGAIMMHSKRAKRSAANLLLVSVAILLLTCCCQRGAGEDAELGFEGIESAEQLAQPMPGREARGARGLDEAECPSSRLAQSLLPAEYAGSPATSQRAGQARAYCDCNADPLGWHLTCFAGSGGPARAASRQSSAGASDAAGQLATAAPLPDQLHPAFRGHQIQRLQLAAAVASRARAGSRLRRAARWMGELSSGSNVNSTSPDDADPEALLNKLPSSTASHDGFGDDAPSLLAPTTTKPKLAHETQPAPARPQSAKKLATIKMAQLRESQKPTNSTSQEESFVSLPSSDTFTMLKQQHQQQQQQQQDSEKVSANNNINNHLMFQTVPVLFSVKYVRNTMIEIDCDQATPNYKPAMFQGKFSQSYLSALFVHSLYPSIVSVDYFSSTLHLASSTVYKLNKVTLAGCVIAAKLCDRNIHSARKTVSQLARHQFDSDDVDDNYARKFAELQNFTLFLSAHL